MYSSQDLDRFYFEYQTEWMPRVISLQAYCSKNGLPYKVLNRWVRDIHSKVVPVEVAGKPELGDVFIVMSRDRRLVRLLTYDRISCSLFEKRFLHSGIPVHKSRT